MRRLLVVVLMVSLGLNAGLVWRLARVDDEVGRPERAEGRGHGHALRDTSRWRGFLERRLERLRVELDLDEEQVGAFRELHREAPGLGRRFRDIDHGRGRILAGIADGELDPAAVRAATVELSRRQAAVDSLIMEKLLRELEILRPDQRAGYLRMLPRDRFGRPGGGDHGPGGGREGHGRRHGPPDDG